MEEMKIKSCLRFSFGCLILLLCGCISIQNGHVSTTPRFYMLASLNESPLKKIINTTPGIMISVGPVQIPEYLNRPQMVTRDNKGGLKFNEFDRWGESLDLGIERMIREDLTMILPAAKLTLYPCNPMFAVKYRVKLEVERLDSDLKGEMFIVVQWMIIDVKNSKIAIIKESRFHQPIIPHDYQGLVQTLSNECASLSGQIAQALSTLDRRGIGQKR